jgi:hypothetical protein
MSCCRQHSSLFTDTLFKGKINNMGCLNVYYKETMVCQHLIFWEQSGSRIHCDIAKREPNWRRSIDCVSLSVPGSQAYQFHMQTYHLKWLETAMPWLEWHYLFSQSDSQLKEWMVGWISRHSSSLKIWPLRRVQDRLCRILLGWLVG